LTDAPSPNRVRHCLNCGTPAPGNYCPACGQETAAGPRKLADFLGGWISRYLTRQGQPWQTLSKLFFAPGALTVEFMAGRRARYLRPFHLYLMISVVVFSAVHLFGLDLRLRFYGERGLQVLRSARPPSAEDHGRGSRLAPVQLILDHLDTPGIRRFAALSPEDRFTFLRGRRAAYVSYFVLLLVPAFALTLGLIYRNRRRTYAEHLVFGLHCQTFLLLILLVEAKLPTLVANALSFWVMGYFTIALKRVYGGTWTKTLVRGCILLTLYFAIFFVANLLLVFALLAL